jgi:hypothetical protein
VLKSAFTDIESTGEEVSETRKVRVLLQGITDTRLANAKSQVLATPALKDTFETALNFISQFLDEKRSYETTRGSGRNVSAVQRAGRTSFQRGRGNQSGGRGMTGQRSASTAGQRRNRIQVADKYYKYSDWIQLTEDQKQQVRDLKAKREA